MVAHPDPQLPDALLLVAKPLEHDDAHHLLVPARDMLMQTFIQVFAFSLSLCRHMHHNTTVNSFEFVLAAGPGRLRRPATAQQAAPRQRHGRERLEMRVPGGARTATRAAQRQEKRAVSKGHSQGACGQGLQLQPVSGLSFIMVCCTLPCLTYAQAKDSEEWPTQLGNEDVWFQEFNQLSRYYKLLPDKPPTRETLDDLGLDLAPGAACLAAVPSAPRTRSRSPVRRFLRSLSTSTSMHVRPRSAVEIEFLSWYVHCTLPLAVCVFCL